jgi:hypothetical protein
MGLSGLIGGACGIYAGYWSSTTSTDFPGSAFLINFSDGAVSIQDGGEEWFIRCVRQ